jgi:hypothetical protein
MPLELAAVTFDGAFTAERELNNLRVSRLDPWMGMVAVLEHHDSGMYFTKSSSPDYGGKRHAPPLGLLGALIGTILEGAGAIKSEPTGGKFGLLADLVREQLPADTSALMLVAESPAVADFVSAVAPRGGQVGWRELSDEQVEQLRLGAARRQ